MECKCKCAINSKQEPIKQKKKKILITYAKSQSLTVHKSASSKPNEHRKVNSKSNQQKKHHTANCTHSVLYSLKLYFYLTVAVYLLFENDNQLGTFVHLYSQRIERINNLQIMSRSLSRIFFDETFAVLRAYGQWAHRARNDEMYSLNLYTAASFLTFLSENLLFTGAR